jgi:hypothetical protein
MKFDLTAQQTAFFTNQGYIELEGIDFNGEEIFKLLKESLSSRLKNISSPSSIEIYKQGRDLWRLSEHLKTFLCKKLFPFASILIGRKSLRLAFDQWIPSNYTWDKSHSLKGLSSIQGLQIGALICSHAPEHSLTTSLGLMPLPSKSTNILFFQPHLILDFPKLISSFSTDLYLIAYTLPNSVYIQNPKDPATNDLKQFGYGFGDPLNNAYHPLLSSS